MNRVKGIHGLLMAAAMMVAVALSAGCQAALPAEVAQLPPAATTTVPADTPVPTDPRPSETSPVVEIATVPAQETQSPAAPTEAPLPLAPESEAAVAAAVADLAQRLGIEEQEILVQFVEAVDWSDSSLGCPQTGMMYAQVITPGFRVLLEVGGVRHVYHTDRIRAAVWCGAVPAGEMPLEDGNANVQDGWPSQPLSDDVIVEPPTERKLEP